MSGNYQCLLASFDPVSQNKNPGVTPVGVPERAVFASKSTNTPTPFFHQIRKVKATEMHIYILSAAAALGIDSAQSAGRHIAASDFEGTSVRLSWMGILEVPSPGMTQDPRDCPCITEHSPMGSSSLLSGLPSLGLVRLFSPPELHALVGGCAEPGPAHPSGSCSCLNLGFYSDAALFPKPAVAECLRALGWRDGWARRPHVAKQHPGQEPWQAAGGWSQVNLLKEW